ncbi:hypothetical protein GE09DRAFT_614572 [Coniochaeta sp. 2T2.1]|nr:hypothetical protein GE09DRAFT_614572 [Coniochaeta sp. 2T2.1]
MKVVFQALLISALGLGSVSAQGFAASCDTKSIKISGTYLTANCKNIFGQVTCGKLDLNGCLKNDGGRLALDSTGAGPHFGDKCVQCSNDPATSGLLTSGPTLLHCKCNPGTGAAQANWPTTTFDIGMCLADHRVP